MKEFKGKDGVDYTILPFPDDSIGGDIMIRPIGDSPLVGEGEDIPGMIMGGGLSGDIVFPWTINDPEIPVPELAGSIIPPWESGNAYNLLIKIKQTLIDAKNANLTSEDKLKTLIAGLDNNYNWNEDYIKDSSILAEDKIQDVENVVDNNLNKIKDYVENFKNEIDEQESMGRSR